MTVEDYLDKPCEAAEMARPVEHYLGVAATLGHPAMMTAQCRKAGQPPGLEPGAPVRATAERVLARVGQEADDALLATPVGGMRLIDYLPSRVLELTVHTLDILAATGSSREAPPSAATVSLRLMADLAVERDRATVLLGSLTGRYPLPPTFNVLPA